MLPSTEPAVELFAILCRMYELDPMGEGVVLSHKEGHARGIATNHGDPEHLWNGLHMGYTMDGFRKAVKNLMRKKEKEEKNEVEKESKPYLVRVKIPDLNIRKGPGTNYPKTGKYTGVGTFTIVDEAAGQGASRWGKLKSGSGWISMDYVLRV